MWEAALQQGFAPDIIGSDVYSVRVSMTLEQVVTLATSAPVQAINRVPKLGTRQIGAPADLSMVEIVEGPVDFVGHAPQHAQGPALGQADADGESGTAVRPALSDAVRLAITQRV